MGGFAATRALLDTKNLGHFIDEKHVELASVSKSATVADALTVLDKLHVLSLPVVDDAGEYAGCISVGDLLRGLMNEMDTNLGEHWVDNISEISAAKLQEIGAHFTSRTITSMIHAGDLWLRGDDKTSLMSVILEGFAIKENKAHHRIFVCDPTKAASIDIHDKTTVLNFEAGSGSVDTSAMRPTDVVSQMDVVRLLQQNQAAMGEVATTRVEDLHVFMGAAFTVASTMTALEAFQHMAADYKSCMGVVDGEGKLVANLSLSDIRGLATGGFERLLGSVVDYAVEVNGGPNIECLTPNNTFGELLDTLVQKKRHRVYILDEVESAISIVTLTDVLRAVVTPETVPVPAATYAYPDEPSSDVDEESEDQ